MKRFIFLFQFFILSINYCISQTVVFGTITNLKNEPVSFVNIAIKGSFDGGSSNTDGFYLFKTSLTGNQTISVSCLGFNLIEQEVNIGSDSLHLDFTLTPVINNLPSVYITAGSFEASDEKRTVILRSNDIGSTAGAMGDISGAVATLPGTQVVGESTGLFVRGGSEHETKIYIDEMVVQNPYYSPVPDIKQRGRFDPFMFSGTIFSTGGYSAQYGQALSSVLVLKSKGLADSTNTGGGIHLYGSRLFHTQRWDKISLHIDLNYNNMEPYHNLFNIERYYKSPENVCGKLIYRQKISERGILKAYANFSGTTMNVKTEDLSVQNRMVPFRLKNNNQYVNLSYKDYFHNASWSLFAGFSYSEDDDNATLNSTNMSENERLLQSRIIVTNKSLSSLTFKSGIELQQLNVNGIIDTLSGNITDQFFAGFSEFDLKISDNIAARLGLRYEYSDYLDRSNLAPRGSVAFKISQHGQVSFATGIFYQHPEKEFLYHTSNRYDFEHASHYILNYQWSKNQRTFRLEFFEKEYANLIKHSSGEPGFRNNGYGYARGVDLFWRDKQTFPDADYWISYSFLDTKRKYKDFPVKATPSFAAKHKLNVVFKYWLESISSMIGFTYIYSSGRPYYNPLRSENQFHTDRTRDYHNLNLNLSWITSLFRRRTVVYISLHNALGRDNIFGYKYFSDSSYRIPVKPVSKRSLFFGCFISTY